MAKNNRRKTNLKTAQRAVDQLSDSYFEKIDIDLETLPSLSYRKKEEITAYFDSDLLEAIRSFAKKRNASYTSVMNDVLLKVFVDDKKEAG